VIEEFFASIKENIQWRRLEKKFLFGKEYAKKRKSKREINDYEVGG
jgi:hypothetical protein